MKFTGLSFRNEYISSWILLATTHFLFFSCSCLFFAAAFWHNNLTFRLYIRICLPNVFTTTFISFLFFFFFFWLFFSFLFPLFFFFLFSSFIIFSSLVLSDEEYETLTGAIIISKLFSYWIGRGKTKIAAHKTNRWYSYVFVSRGAGKKKEERKKRSRHFIF